MKQSKVCIYTMSYRATRESCAITKYYVVYASSLA